MTKHLSVFVDTDVIVSSLISNQGAAHKLINKSDTELHTSNLALQQQNKVCKKLDLNSTKLTNIQKSFKSTTLPRGVTQQNQKYNKYVKDANDSHIVAGAVNSGSQFIITYNTKHYQLNKLKTDFDIIVLTPGQYLQYQRSLI